MSKKYSRQHYNRLIRNRLNIINHLRENVEVEPQPSSSQNASILSTSFKNKSQIELIVNNISTSKNTKNENSEECGLKSFEHHELSNNVEYSDDDYSESSNDCNTITADDISDDEKNNYEKNLNVNSVEEIFHDLHSWAVQHKIPHVALKELLSILRKSVDFSMLPKDPRTFLQTPRNTLIHHVNPGHYCHIGILNGLNNLFKNRIDKIPKVIKLSINIDGLPLSRSSGSQLYPILGMVKNCIENRIFPIGIYHGYEKPSNFNELLHKFVEEAADISGKSIIVCGIETIFEIEMLLFDAVAKSSVLFLKGHGGYSSCSKCTQEGIYFNRRVCFPDINFTKRTHDDFVAQTQEDHHIGRTILEKIPNLDLIDKIPLDYMHLVLLGVVKRLLVGTWIFGLPPHKLSSHQIILMSEKLISLKQYIPCEFARKPRSLKEVKQFKATEYRQFLLYTGPIVLKGILDSTKYDHFLTLQVAITILLSPVWNSLINFSEELLKHFVLSCKIIYGSEFLVHNVHNLLHLCDDARRFGTLDSFSNFGFENYLQKLKKLVRKPNNILPQIMRRLAEIINVDKSPFNNINKELNYKFEKEHNNGILIDGCISPQYQEMYFTDYKLDLTERNRCCKLKCGTIVEIFNFAYSSLSKETMIVGKKYLTIENFFNKPCDSSVINVHIVRHLSANFMTWPASHICYKLVRLPYESNWVVYPLLHTP